MIWWHQVIQGNAPLIGDGDDEQPSELCMDGMLWEQEDIQTHAIALPHAPEFFRERYDTQRDFTWAGVGFNTLLSSFEWREAPDSFQHLRSDWNADL